MKGFKMIFARVKALLVVSWPVDLSFRMSESELNE